MTRISKFVVRPVFIIALTVFMVGSAALSGWALTTAWNAKGREITVARTEAQHAVNAAQAAAAKAEAAQQQQRLAQAKASQQLVMQLCTLVHINSDTTGAPPTTVRGFQIAAAWKKFGENPLLHCNT